MNYLHFHVTNFAKTRQILYLLFLLLPLQLLLMLSYHVQFNIDSLFVAAFGSGLQRPSPKETCAWKSQVDRIVRG